MRNYTASDPIVLSSDDDDEEDDVPIITWFTQSRKRSRDVFDDADGDVTVIEKAPCLEGRIVEKGLITVAENKHTPQDDDCCILDDDPHDIVQVPYFQANEADELVVVGERGHVACRDYPHARHLCVKFPFTTTPHEKHCDQCHCFVCDVVAPCSLWGQGGQGNDHCHAFDKGEEWKLMRSQARSLVKNTSLQLPPAELSGRRQQLGPLLGTGGVRTPTNYSTLAPSSIIAPSLAMVQSPINWAPSPRLTRSPVLVRSPTNFSAYPSNQWTANLGPMPGNPRLHVPSAVDSLPGNLQPVPSEVGTVLANDYRFATRGGNGNSMGNPHPGLHAVVPKAMGHFNQSIGAFHNNNPTPPPSCPPAGRHTGHQPPGNPLLPWDSSRNIQGYTAMPNNSTYSCSQLQPYMASETRSPQVVHYPGESPFVIMTFESPDGAMQRDPLPPSPLRRNFHRDLTTLQRYLMEGVSGQQSQAESTAPGVGTAATGSMQPPSVSADQFVPSQGTWSDPLEGSRNSMEGTLGDGIQAVQTSRAADAAHQLCHISCGNDTLEQLLASLDDDLWDLLDPTNLEFLNAAVH